MEKGNKKNIVRTTATTGATTNSKCVPYLSTGVFGRRVLELSTLAPPPNVLTGVTLKPRRAPESIAVTQNRYQLPALTPEVMPFPETMKTVTDIPPPSLTRGPSFAKSRPMETTIMKPTVKDLPALNMNNFTVAMMFVTNPNKIVF